MSTENMVAGKYARALLLLAQERGTLEEIKRDLLLLADIFGQGTGRELLATPQLSLEDKQNRVREMLAGRVSQLAVTFLQLLLEKRRGDLVQEISQSYGEQLNLFKGEHTAKLTVAAPLTEVELTEMREKLRVLVGSHVDLEQIVDPSLRGGARLNLGDLVLDGSLGARLEKMRKVLLGETGAKN